jgi:GDPmannose 4,6-dehydratase
VTKKRALITGITGQDGAYLAKFLCEKGYEVFGIFRRTSTPNFWRLQSLDLTDRVVLIPGDVTDAASLMEAVKSVQPDELYNLAAQSYVGASFDAPLATGEVDGLAPTRILEILRAMSPETRFYQASSSEVFGNSFDGERPLDENSRVNPMSPYAAAKLHAQDIARIYREAYGLFAVNGILFNHESPLRGLEFVTRKISNTVARISHGLDDVLTLGSLESRRDWGYAPDYVEAMWMMLQEPRPDDYVIATGVSHSVREFAEAAFRLTGLNPEKHLRVNKALLRPTDVNHLIGDSSKARQTLGWRPTVAFDELVKIMVTSDIERWRRRIKGEVFAWDAPSYVEWIGTSRSKLT